MTGAFEGGIGNAEGGIRNKAQGLNLRLKGDLPFFALSLKPCALSLFLI
jgi:hypothetical protein